MKGLDKIRLSLTGKILIMTLVVVIISNTVLGIVSFNYSEKSLTADVNARLKTLSDDLSNQIVAINTREFKMLHSLAAMDIFRDENISQEVKQDHLTSVLKELGGKYENLAFYDENGDAIIAAGKKMNFAARAYFSEAFAGKDYVSDPTFSTVTNSVLQHYSVPVYGQKTNRPIGALILVINGNSLYDTIKDIDLGGGMHPSVISRSSGTTIANANENTDESTEDDLDPNSKLGQIIEAIIAGKSGIEDFVDPSIGMHIVCSYEPIPTTQWSIFAVAPYDYYFGALKNMQIQFIVLLIITIIVAIIICSILTNALIKPLRTVKNSITEIASGNADLTRRIPAASNDEIGDVVNGFNQFVEKLQHIVQNLLDSKNSLTTIDGDLQASTQDASASITQIIANIESVNNHILTQAASVTETAGAVNEISSNIESLEKMIEHQASGVTQASAAVEQMIGNISSVNNAVNRMVESFGQLEEKANFGISSQTNANEQIAQIKEQSIMLQDANAAIANIAEQTNLLAMNAAIEAAHAGEAGKGFSVVADEIRKLSETSSSQSKTIGAELGKIQDTIQNVVEVSNTTNAAFSTVSKSIIETSQIIEQIRGAMAEQQTGSKQIIEALSAMNNSTSEVKIASAEMTEGNKQILSEIQKLQNATDMIKNSVEEMHIGASRINDTGAALSTISSQVSGNITQIGEEIGLFKV